MADHLAMEVCIMEKKGDWMALGLKHRQRSMGIRNREWDRLDREGCALQGFSSLADYGAKQILRALLPLSHLGQPSVSGLSCRP